MTSAANTRGTVQPTTRTMRAITHDRFGGPEVLSLSRIEIPSPVEDQVLIRVEAASVNPYDWHFMRAKPYIARSATGFRKPKHPVLGVDVAGVVEAVGPDVTEFSVGDEVFGGAIGAFAEYVCGRDKNLVHKPEAVDFPSAAATPLAGYTALQAVRDKGVVGEGQRVLVIGASGGVGSFAVQIASALGAEVTGVCSTRNVDMVRSIGADHVIDYTVDDFARGDTRYDVILDNICDRPMSTYRRALTDDGRYVLIGKFDIGDWFGPIAMMVKPLLGGFRRSQTMVGLMAKQTKQDLTVLAGMLESGEITPVIDRTYPLEEVPDAIEYLEGFHARGKVVIEV